MLVAGNYSASDASVTAAEILYEFPLLQSINDTSCSGHSFAYLFHSNLPTMFTASVQMGTGVTVNDFVPQEHVDRCLKRPGTLFMLQGADASQVYSLQEVFAEGYPLGHHEYLGWYGNDGAFVQQSISWMSWCQKLTSSSAQGTLSAVQPFALSWSDLQPVLLEWKTYLQ